MKLFKIEPGDGKRSVTPHFTIAEAKALYNALSMDNVNGDPTTPGVDVEGLLDRLEAYIAFAGKPKA